MTANLTREQEIELAYAALARQNAAEKASAWEKADKELQHQRPQSV